MDTDKFIHRAAQHRRHLAGVNRVNSHPIASLSAVALETGVMRLIAVDWGALLLLLLFLAVDPEMCASPRDRVVDCSDPLTLLRQRHAVSGATATPATCGYRGRADCFPAEESGQMSSCMPRRQE